MKTIICAIHGYTHWESSFLKIINTVEFQRMKRIKQLAAVHHVFPCAVHTRFEHSIGVGYLAECFAKSLMQRQDSLQMDVLAVKLAGLCHDIGHGPLSHAYDHFLKSKDHRLWKHEERSVVLLRHIVSKYNIDIDNTTLETACELIHPVKHNLPMYMYQIIANDVDGVDVDKLDYLCRDSKHTGMKYQIDIFRFFQYSRVIGDRLCYSKKSMPYEINNVFAVRHQLHAQVYQHTVVRAIEHMYTDIMKLLGSSIYPNISNIHTLTDSIFSFEFCELCLVQGKINTKQANEINTLLRRIHTRDLYKCIDEINVSKNGVQVEGDQGYKHFIVDVVNIGYTKNPLFDIQYYIGDTICKLHVADTSHLFSLYPRDCLVRVYDKIPNSDE